MPPDTTDERADQYKAWAAKAARKIWEQGLADHPRVIAYLAARGIDVARLPGGAVPFALRYHASCYESNAAAGPAMIAAFVSDQDEVEGLHRTYLDPGGAPRKRDEELGNAKKMLGGCDGRAIRLGLEYADGVLILAEGIETALACSAATGYSAWACGDAGRISRIRLPFDLVKPLREGGLVHTVVIAADLDSSYLTREKIEEFAKEMRREIPGISPADAKHVGSLPTGERWAFLGAARIEAAHPWLAVRVEIPTPATAPGLVEASAAGAPKAIVGKGVDWLDVYARHGAAGVRNGLLAGVDLEAARERSAAASSGSLPIPTVQPPTAGTRVEGAAASSGGERGGDEAGESPRGGEDGIAKPPRPWIRHKSWDDLPIIDNGGIERARRWLWTQMREDGERRFLLARWGGQWWVYSAGRYAKVTDEWLRSVLWDWLNGFRYIKGSGKSAKTLKLMPTSKMVDEIIRALAIDTAARVEQMPARLSPVIDDAGEPMWGEASSFAGLAARAGQDGSLKNKIVFINGVLDLVEVGRTKKVELAEHSPEIFTATCLPFELDVARLQRLIDGENPEDVYAEVCPKFRGWSADASDGDPDWELQHQEMLGDLVSSDRSIEKIFVMVGNRRSGKGYNEDIIGALLGEENVAALLLDQLGTDRYATYPLVGKAAALGPDAHIGRMAQNAGLTELLKVISGQGRLPVRDLYQSAVTVKIGARIVLFCNDEPDLQDESTALAGRFVFLPLRKSAFGREDESIKKSVEVEAPGIMLYAIMGAIRLANKPSRRIDLCPEAQEMGDEFERYSAHLKAFVDDWIIVDEKDQDNGIEPDDLYNAYCAWCSTVAERKPLGKGKFWKKVKWHMPRLAQPRQEDGSRPRVYLGASLRSDKKEAARGWAARQAARSDDGGWRPDEPELPM